VWVNYYNVFDAALPLGGSKQSGWGRENGEAVIDLSSESKTVVIGLRIPGPPADPLTAPPAAPCPSRTSRRSPSCTSR
jgi:hypothetical protein